MSVHVEDHHPVCSEYTCSNGAAVEVLWPGRGGIAYGSLHGAKAQAVLSTLGCAATSRSRHEEEERG